MRKKKFLTVLTLKTRDVAHIVKRAQTRGKHAL